MCEDDETPPVRPPRRDCFLVVLDGPRTGDLYRLRSGELVVGRTRDADLRMPEEQVSRVHARITRRNGLVWIEDLGSTHGTFRNGERVTAPVRLRDGDVVRFGPVHAVKFSCAPLDDGATQGSLIAPEDAP